MLWQFITCLAFMGIRSVYADSHGCATTEKVNEVNIIVASLEQSLGPIFGNSSLTNDQKNAMILDKVCNDTQGVRAQVDNIEAKLGECAALATASEVKNLTLGAMSFKDLFERFDNVDNFCGKLNKHPAGCRKLDLK
ncbi:uncharacterized protein LOC123554744 isoform X3 [Mercenaria mercenaria]|uniref:uncharacterized protein LOC123554744 isoform X1 n=1 Tax=Mercenaria mercenaria TaxID=6596 RepID=UPI00234E6808|nr:uncharacterized protein LOC123554744 isoform X1 [Mercenaria mercenaria]XP_053403767.1 uncharacterized protein LOC123554744 isoform X3 [Mercenaria mercenaria]